MATTYCIPDLTAEDMRIINDLVRNERNRITRLRTTMPHPDHNSIIMQRLAAQEQQLSNLVNATATPEHA